MGHGTGPRRGIRLRQGTPASSTSDAVLGSKCKQSHTQTHGHTQVNQGNFGLLYCVTQPKNYFKEKTEVQLIISIWDAVTQTSFTVFQETQGTGLNLTPAQPHLCHVTPPAP